MTQEIVDALPPNEFFATFQELVDLLQVAEINCDVSLLKKIGFLLDTTDGLPADVKPRIPYLKARLSLANANANIYADCLKEASAYLNELIKYANAALRQDATFSDTHRVLGEGLGRIIFVKGGMSGVVHGKRSHDALSRAIELNPKNSAAYCAFGVWKLKTPKLWGGNMEDAIRLLKKAIELDASNPIAFAWLGTALAEQKNFGAALVAFQSALRLQPANNWIQKEFEKLKLTETAA